MNLKQQLAALQKAMRAIVDGAKDREMTDAEVADLEAKTAEAVELKAKIERAEKIDALAAGIGDVEDETPDAGDSVGAKSLGEHFVKTAGDRLTGVKGQRFSAASTEFKAAIDPHLRPASLAPAYTDIDTRLVTGVRRRLTIADLLGSESISGAAITYFVEGALEGAPTTVAEGAAKPQLHLADPTAVTESLKKLAGFIKESDEIIEDLPWFVSVINGRLVYELDLLEENQLLNGNGNGSNLRGILQRSGIQTETSAAPEDNADALFRAITKVSTGSGLDADGLVINPIDYQRLRLAKDGNGQYFGGGFFSGQYGQGGMIEQPPVWGLRTVVTPAVEPGKALVGAFGQGGSVIRKGGTRVEATNSEGNDFTHNRITIRAERRLALAVRRPAAFVDVTLDN